MQLDETKKRLLAISIVVILIIATIVPLAFLLSRDKEPNGKNPPPPPPPPVNRAPSAFFSMSSTTVLHNMSVIFNASGSRDPDGDNLTYAWVLGDGENATGLEVDHVYKADGNFTVTMTVSDGNLSNSTSRSVLVINGEPSIVDWSPRTSPVTDEVTAVDFKVVATDPNHDTLSYHWDLDGVPLNATGTGFKYVPDHDSAGIHNISVIVSDGIDPVRYQWIVNVLNVNRPPVIDSIDPIGDVLMKEGQEQLFTLTASDPDGDPLLYQWYFNGMVVSGETGVSYLYRAGFVLSGTYTVEVRVTDKILSVNHKWTMTVEDVNRPPMIDAVEPDGDVTINETETVVFKVTASDPDGDELSFIWTVDTVTLPTGAEFNFSTNYTSAGIYVVTVDVSDGHLNATHTWNLTVMNRNRAPTAVAAVDMFTKKKGEAFTFNGSGSSDPDGDELAYSWDLGDGNASTEEAPAWGYSAPGAFVVVLNVSDGDLSDMDTILVNVTPSLDEFWKKGPLPDPGIIKILLADIDNDVDIEIVVGTNREADEDGTAHGNLTIYDLDTQQEEWQSPDIGGVTDFEIANIDVDAALEIIVSTVSKSTEDATGANTTISGHGYVFDGATHAEEWRSRDIGGALTIEVGNADVDDEVELVFGYSYNMSFNAGTFSFDLKGGVIVFGSDFSEEWNSTGYGITNVFFVGDLNCDSNNEIVMSALKSLTFISVEVNLSILSWDGSTYDESFTRTDLAPNTVNIANLYGDCTSEILVGQSLSVMGDLYGNLTAMDHTLTTSWETGDIGQVSVVTYGNVDDDPFVEVVVGVVEEEEQDFMLGETYYVGRVIVLSFNGTEEWRSENISKPMSLAIGDFVGDDFFEIAVAAVDIEREDDDWNCTLMVFDGVTRTEVARVDGLGAIAMHAMVIVDVDIDGKDELILGTTQDQQGWLYCYKFE